MARFPRLKSRTGPLPYAPARPPEVYGILKALGLKSCLERLPLKATAGRPLGEAVGRPAGGTTKNRPAPEGTGRLNMAIAFDG